jgi:hypothetical protein
MKAKHPDLDSLSLQRYVAAGILALIEKARAQDTFDEKVLVDWYVKLARVAEGYARYEQDEPHDLLQIRADLDRLTPEQLLALKIEREKTVRFCGTGERGDRVILDDPHNVVKMESQIEREKTVRFFRESMSNRLNDDRSAIVVIMQRLHEGDVSGDILVREANYCHLMIPMRFEPMIYPASADGERTEDPAGFVTTIIDAARWRDGVPVATLTQGIFTPRLSGTHLLTRRVAPTARSKIGSHARGGVFAVPSIADNCCIAASEVMGHEPPPALRVSEDLSF